MSADEFLKAEYMTLRDEISACKARLFRIVVLGSVLIPLAGYLANRYDSYFTNASAPFLVLVLMMAFIAEQNAIIRAGRYLREHVEPRIEGVVGWEKWLESGKRFREADRVFFASFVVIFFVFYVISTLTALEGMQRLVPEHYRAALVGYGVGGVWFLAVLLRHWHSCTTTRE